MSRVATFATNGILWIAAALSMTAVVITGLIWMSGLHPIVVTSASMSPTIPAGSVVLSREVPVSAIYKGDVVTVQLGPQRRVTHRVVNSTTSPDGTTEIWLKGDANEASDAAPVQARTIMRMEGHFAGAGTAFIALRSPAALFVIGVLLGVIVLTISNRARRTPSTDSTLTNPADLVSTLGQELRTPLTSIVGYAELLADGEIGPLDKEQQRVIDIVHRNANRLSDLVSHVP